MSGDRDEEFRRFVQAHRQGLLRTARLLTGDSGHAEDLVQTALLKTYRHWPRVAAGGDPLPYVRRMLVAPQTGRWRLGPTEQLLTSVTGRPADPAAEQDEQMLAALHGLPPRMRAVVVLRFYEDLSEAETAELLGCPVDTVTIETSAALDRLRELLAPSPHERKAGRR